MQPRSAWQSHKGPPVPGSQVSLNWPLLGESRWWLEDCLLESHELLDLRFYSGILWLSGLSRGFLPFPT